MTLAHRHRAQRGLTLIELLVAAAMGSVIIAGAISLFLGQQRAFQAGAGDRSIQESARVALEEITSSLRRAGYGIDQAVAFDFGHVANVRLENTPPSTGLVTGEPLGATVATVTLTDCPAGSEVTCRDSITGTDELVFRYRSPSFGPHVLASAPTATQLVVQTGLANGLPAGQELLVVCYGAEPRLWAYVTVNTAVAPAATTIPLRASASTGTARDFPRQTDLFTNTAYNGCFARSGNDAPRVFLVERLRYFIQRYADPSGVQRPYLMVSRGADSNPQPVAPDVEDLQVAYIFPFIEGRTPSGTASPNLAERIVGNVPGTRLASSTTASSTTSIDLSDAFPTQAEARLLVSDPTTGTLANRTPSNIRAVRVALVVRSPIANASVDSSVPASLNRPALTPPANELRFRRFQVEATVFLNNMTTVHSYVPYYRSISTAPGSLFGGG